MNEPERRTINELVVRYELEPSIRDVFVEGRFDQEVLSSCFRSVGQNDRIVYEIDTIDIPRSLLIANGLTLGNKQRVITLARELAKLRNDCSYRCLVDKDLDHWFGVLESVPRLIWTEYCSIELYFFSDELLRDLLITTAKSKIGNWEEYCCSLITTLRNLYALRLTDRELGWSLEWLSVDRCLSRCNCRIELALTDYIDRLLLSNKKSRSKKDFTGILTKWQTKLRGDYRCYIRGHDFVELLAWTVNKFDGIKAFSSSVAIERIFVLLAHRIPNLMNKLQ